MQHKDTGSKDQRTDADLCICVLRLFLSVTCTLSNGELEIFVLDVLFIEVDPVFGSSPFIQYPLDCV